MVVPFEQWLARSSTHALLRSLTDDTTIYGRHLTRRTCSASQRRAQATFALPFTLEADLEERKDHGDESLVKDVTTSASPRLRSKTALRKLGERDTGQIYSPNRLESKSEAARELSILSRQAVADAEEGTLQSPWLADVLEMLQIQWQRKATIAMHQTWQELSSREGSLPTTGTHAEEIWHICSIAALFHFQATKEDTFILDVLRTARKLFQENGHRYVHLFRDVVGVQVLNTNISNNIAEKLARRWQKRMINYGLTRPEDLLALLDDVLRSSSPPASFQRFKLIYFQQRSDDLDRQCVRLVKQFGHLPSAQNMVQFFSRTASTKTPLDAVSNHPAVTALMGEQPLRLAEPAGGLPFTRQTMNVLLGEAHGVSEKGFSDRFWAKILATGFFSLESSIKLLQILGAERLGNTALQELARRAERCGEITARLEQARKLGIHIEDSVYYRMIKRFAQAEDEAMLRQLLASDQHPDEYASYALQKRLLVHAVDNKQWLQMELALMAINVSGRDMEPFYWNVLLRHHASETNMEACRRVLDAMRSKSMPVTARTVHSVLKAILPHRAPGKASRTESKIRGWHHDALIDFAVAVSMYSADCGQAIHPRLFTELLKRCGKSYRSQALERLVQWLSKFYSPHSIATWPDRLAYKFEVAGSTPLEAIFQPKMTQAIVIWLWNAAALHQNEPMYTESHRSSGPRTRSLSTLETTNDWSRGIALLRELHDGGFPVHKLAIQKAVLDQLWRIFGPGQSARRINGLVQRRNCLSLHQYVADANQIWPGLMPLLDTDIPLPLALRKLFGRRARRHRRRP